MAGLERKIRWLEKNEFRIEDIYFDYVEKLLGRPFLTHELASPKVREEKHIKSEKGFLKLLCNMLLILNDIILQVCQ